MSNVLSEEKRQQVLALGRLGWSLRRIAVETGVCRKTAGSYLKVAGVDLRPPGRWGRGPPKVANEVTTDFGAGIASSGAARPAAELATDPQRPLGSHCADFHELIEDALRRGRNAMGIYQGLVDDHGFAHSYESVKRYVRALRGARTPEAHPIITTAPGEEGQVDYGGDGPMVRDPKSRKYRRTRLFTLVLGCSRKAVRLVGWKSSSKVWSQFHETAFRKLGGAPKTIVLDNLKEGVLQPDTYEPTLNPLYRDMLRHYGVVAIPCRVRHPDRKGKVEAGIGHAQRTPLKGMRFETMEEAQAYLDHWEDRWADTRIHGTTKRQVAAMFAEEKPYLLPMPAEPFRYYEFGERTVHLDGCVEVQGAYYMAPPGHIGRRLQVQWDDLHVRLIKPRSGSLLREHLRTGQGRYRIQPEDRPARTPSTTLKLLARASHAGAAIGTLCAEIHRREPDGGPRRILGILALARRHDLSVVERACAAALEGGVPTYRFVRSYVERHPTPQLSLKQVDELIRPLTHYRDLISRITQPKGDTE